MNMSKTRLIFGGRAGFTLIELLIVVAIIAILAAIAVPNFLEAQTRAKVTRAKADMKSLVTGLESYMVDYSKYINGYGFTDTAYNEETNTPCALILLTTPVAYIESLPGKAPFGAAMGNM